MGEANSPDALAEDNRRYRLLIDAITDYAIYMLDASGVVASWNPGAQRFKGYRAHEILGQNFSRFYTDEDRAVGLPQRALRIAAEEGRYENEGWRVRKDGSRFWAHVVIDPVRDLDGNVIGFAKITRDLTERRDAQRALEETQKALVQSQKLESIGQLTGGVAHDFNNLLMAVLGSLELLQKWVPDHPKAQALLNNAVQGAERGAQLTRRMLAFARRQDLKLEAVDIALLADGMTGLLQRAIGPTIVVRTDFPDELPAACTDPGQLESAVMNLAVNARDAMPEGGTITISGRTAEISAADRRGVTPGAYVVLSVADTGMGMDEQTLARATEPFFTTKGVGKGTGLGLSMAHGLAEQSNGKLIIESTPGEGSTVELWLPVAEGGRAPWSGPTPANEAAATTERLSILAVDDDNLVLMNTTAMLEDLGHRVLEASDGRSALDMVLRDPSIDLVITDQAMPGMTGLQLAEAIRKHKPRMPVIIATGYAELPASASAATRRLAKPFKQADLADAVAAVGGTLPGPHG